MFVYQCITLYIQLYMFGRCEFIRIGDLLQVPHVRISRTYNYLQKYGISYTDRRGMNSHLADTIFLHSKIPGKPGKQGICRGQVLLGVSARSNSTEFSTVCSHRQIESSKKIKILTQTISAYKLQHGTAITEIDEEYRVQVQ